MSWSGWFRKGATTSPSLESSRLVVFDLETTGLDTRNDQPIELGAVAIQHGAVSLGGQFNTRIHSLMGSKPQATLAHRISGDDLHDAPPASEVLPQFLDYINGAPCLAYHSAFDDQFLCRGYKNIRPSVRWGASLDVAHWLLWLHPELGPTPPTLDQALAFARIRRSGRQRHNALVDAMLTAQLVLTLLPKTRLRGVNNWEELCSRLKLARKLRLARAPG